MGRRPNRNNDVDLEELAPELSQEAIDFEDFLTQVAPGTSGIDVFRMKRDGSRPRIDRISIDALREDAYGFLVETYGGGKYLLRFRGSDGKWHASKVLEVEAMKEPEKSLTPNNNNGSTGDFLREQLAMQQNMITALITSMKPPPMPDMGALLTGIASMVGAMKPASSPDPGSMLAAVASVFSTLRGPAKDEDWLERSAKIIEMAKNLTPDSGGGSDSWAGVARDVSKVVMEKLTSGGTPPENPPAALVRMPAPAIPPSLPPAVVALPKETLPQMPAGTVADWIKVGLAYLKEKARLGKDPDVFIEWLLETREEEPQCAAIVGALEQGATFEQLLQFDPEIAGNPAYVYWFRKLYDGISTELQESLDSSGANRNPSNAVDHAPVGAPSSEPAASPSNGGVGQ